MSKATPSQLIIVNPAAGRGEGNRAGDRIANILKGRGVDYEFVRTAGPGDATRHASEAGGKFDRVISVGGDGTLHEVVNGLMTIGRKKRPMVGMVPVGTGNDYPKSVQIPKKLEDALEVALTGNRRTVDVGHISGDGLDEYFCNNVGIGFDALVSREIKNVKFFRGAPVYMIAALKSTISYQPSRMKILLDENEVREGLFHSITIGIGRVCGGGFHLTPDAEVDDGLFDVAIIDGKHGKLAVLRHAGKIRAGTHTDLPFVEIVQSASVTIEASEPVRFHADGEDITGPPTVTFETKAGALDVLVP